MHILSRCVCVTSSLATLEKYIIHKPKFLAMTEIWLHDSWNYIYTSFLTGVMTTVLTVLCSRSFPSWTTSGRPKGWTCGWRHTPAWPPGTGSEWYRCDDSAAGFMPMPCNSNIRLFYPQVVRNAKTVYQIQRKAGKLAAIQVREKCLEKLLISTLWTFLNLSHFSRSTRRSSSSGSGTGTEIRYFYFWSLNCSNYFLLFDI